MRKDLSQIEYRFCLRVNSANKDCKNALLKPINNFMVYDVLFDVSLYDCCHLLSRCVSRNFEMISSPLRYRDTIKIFS